MTGQDQEDAVTPKTAAFYSAKFDSLKKEFHTQHPIFSPEIFAQWLVNTKLKLAAKTWRLYRAATVYCITQNYPEDSNTIKEYLSAYSTNNRHTLITRQKAKDYTDDRFQQLVGYIKTRILKRPSAFWWDHALHTLLAGDLVGLRPSEWEDANLVTVDHKPCLKVKNAKNTHGRSHGEFRTIELDNFSQSDLAIIEKKIDLARSFLRNNPDSDIDSYNKAIRQCLNIANNAVDPNAKTTVANYTTRHQFTADIKKTKTDDEAATLLGHRSNKTARLHYGRKNKGRIKSNTPGAHADDLQRVVALNAGTNKGPSPTPGPF